MYGLSLPVGTFDTGSSESQAYSNMIALDGISVEGFKKAKTPNIDALMSEGTLFLETRDVMPSVTLPNWTCILIGSGPEQHGIVDNEWEKAKEPSLPPVELTGEIPQSIFK